MLLWGMFTGSRFGLAAISLRVKEQHILCAACNIATVQPCRKGSAQHATNAMHLGMNTHALSRARGKASGTGGSAQAAALA
jgi:hypothetical protein